MFPYFRSGLKCIFHPLIFHFGKNWSINLFRTILVIILCQHRNISGMIWQMPLFRFCFFNQDTIAQKTTLICCILSLFILFSRMERLIMPCKQVKKPCKKFNRSHRQFNRRIGRKRDEETKVSCL